MQRRLVQLRAALNDGPADGLSPGHDASLQPASAPQAALRHRVFRASTLLTTALVSASIGATGAWVVAHTADQAPASPANTSQVAVGAVSESAQAPPASLAVTPPPPTPSPAPASTDAQQVAAALEGWRQAWSSRDVQAYLGHYSENFVPVGGQTRDAWAASRQKNISARANISVQLRDLQVEPTGADRAQARFRQDYAAGSFREQNQPKQIELVREGAQWRVVSERQGNS